MTRIQLGSPVVGNVRGRSDFNRKMKVEGHEYRDGQWYVQCRWQEYPSCVSVVPVTDLRHANDPMPVVAVLAKTG